MVTSSLFNGSPILPLLDAPRISMRGCVRPSVRRSVGPSVRPSFRRSVTRFFQSAELKPKCDLTSINAPAQHSRLILSCIRTCFYFFSLSFPFPSFSLSFSPSFFLLVSLCVLQTFEISWSPLMAPLFLGSVKNLRVRPPVTCPAQLILWLW